MVYGKDFLVYNNELFNFTEIRDAMFTYQDLGAKEYGTYDSESDEYRQWLWAVENYESAQDRIAKLLYYFGKDIKMQYSIDGSGINNNFNVIDALSKLGYMTINTRMQDFSNKLAFEHVKNKYMLYISGVDEISGKGHAWIIDGASYLPLYIRKDDIYVETMIALHCNWGWGGLYDGYYSGDILEVGLPEDAPYHYIYSKKLQFFAFKR